MSMPLRLTEEGLEHLVEAMRSLTDITRSTGVNFVVFQPLQVQVGEDGPVLSLSWDAETKAYYVDDRIGS